MSAGFPLSPLQEARWAWRRAEPRFPWASSLTLALRGECTGDALRAALDQLVLRHEILRTRFLCPSDGAAPRMQVEASARASFEQLDWSAKTRVEREREGRRLEEALRVPYPLDGSTPLRVVLVRLGPSEHWLVLAQSALAADWRALWALAQELAGLLAGERGDENPAQVADLSQWLRDTLEGEEASAGLAQWAPADLQAASALRLPLEFERPAQPWTVHEHARQLAPGLQESLRKLAASRGLPLSALLCAVWQAALARLSEREELVLGVRSAGRAFQGLEGALGTFERALPLTCRLDERVSLLQLARRTDEELARGTEWHEFFQPERLGAAPDFSFRYAFEHMPLVEPVQHGALELEVLRRDGFGEPFRVLLRVEETHQELELRFAYDRRYLGAADVAALAEATLALLENAVARPDSPLAGLSAVGLEQRARLLEFTRGPALSTGPHALEGAQERTMDEWILEVARARPEACALAAGGAELSYQALEQRSGALAAELVERGAGPGSLVGVHLERSPDLVVALLAVLRAGAAYVPLPPSYPRERVLHVLADSGADLVIGSGTSAAALTGYRGTLLLAHAPRATPSAAPRGRATGTDLAYVIYTSGSTGKPKGVPITHANLCYSTRARLAHYPGRVGRYLLLSSFAFDSSVAGLFWTLVQGGTLVLPPEDFERDLASLPALIERTQPTHVLALPSLWALVLEQAGPAQLDSLETVIVAGESCPPELVRRHHAARPRTRLFNEYGPTEGTVWSTVFDTSTPFERAQVPIGRPIPGASNYVLTPTRELAPLGQAGELWIGGPGVCAGYLRRPELTAERFAEDPFTGGRMYRSGDRARLLPDGNLEFLGRLDHQVKIRGHRIELEEIESVLAAHPAVREALVMAREEPGRGARLVAYVLAIGPRPAETDLLRYLGERLPEYMVPARALCLEHWPLLPNGKIARAALPAPEEARTFAEPEGALEVVLAALWADVLGLEEIGRHDDFFALGGHSLSATRLYARLKETLQVSVPLRVLFEQRTPAALAQELRRDPLQAARVERLAEVVLSVLESEPGEEHALGA